MSFSLHYIIDLTYLLIPKKVLDFDIVNKKHQFPHQAQSNMFGIMFSRLSRACVSRKATLFLPNITTLKLRVMRVLKLHKFILLGLTIGIHVKI